MFFNRLLDALRHINTPAMDEEVAKPGVDTDVDTRRLRVMVSSPLTCFAEEREALQRALALFSDVDTRLFERLPDSGHTDVTESTDLAKRCDLFVALFDPARQLAHEIEAANPKLSVKFETIGMLASSGPGGDDRRVTIAVTLGRLPKGVRP